MFADQSKYNKMFHQVVHKGGESAIKYIKIFQDATPLIISMGNSYTEYQSMHTMSDIFQKVENYSDQIEIHQAELRREEKLIDKNHYLYRI